MPVNFRLDHVVIRVYDLAAAAAAYTKQGFNVVPGGEHPGLGSRNALIAFEDDTYLELIAYGSGPPEQIVPRSVRFHELAGRPPVERHWLPWESSPEGLVDFALLPSNIDEALAAVRAHGQYWEGPIPGTRLRPDGQRVAWQLGLPQHLELPFFCADVTPRSLRVPTGQAQRHPNDTRGIAGIVVAVADLAASARRYGELLGLPPTSEFTLGTTTIALVPAAPAVSEGPVEVELRLPSPAKFTLLPPSSGTASTAQTAARKDRLGSPS